MKLGNSSPSIETLFAAIAHSQIVLAQPRRPVPRLPVGYDRGDIAVLDWIAIEGARSHNGPLPI